jgi:hypothetical protein
MAEEVQGPSTLSAWHVKGRLRVNLMKKEPARIGGLFLFWTINFLYNSFLRN